MFLQLYVFKGLSCIFVDYRHLPFKDKFARVLLVWGLFWVNYIICVWERALCDGLGGHWDWLGLILTYTPGNGFRHVCLLGSDVSTLVSDASTLIFGAATTVKCTFVECAAVVGLWTLGGGGVGGMQVFGVGGMRSLRRFLCSLIFGLVRGGTVVNW